jgi:hypothetical protein
MFLPTVFCSLSPLSQQPTCVKQPIIPFTATYLCEAAYHPVHSNLPVWSSLSSCSQQPACVKQHIIPFTATCLCEAVYHPVHSNLCEAAYHPVHSNLSVWNSIFNIASDHNHVRKPFGCNRWRAFCRSEDSLPISHPGCFEAAAAIALSCYTRSLTLALEILFLRITWLRRDWDGDRTQVQKKVTWRDSDVH